MPKKQSQAGKGYRASRQGIQGLTTKHSRYFLLFYQQIRLLIDKWAFAIFNWSEAWRWWWGWGGRSWSKGRDSSGFNSI